MMAALAILSGPSQAAIQVAGTRVIFDGSQKEQTVRLTNAADQPVLTQIWLDTGEESTDNTIQTGAQSTPFIINPPVARINGGKAQVVRIFKTAEVASLPRDRESVFWLNILEIPAKAAKVADAEPQSDENRLNIALRTRLKFFYRPAGLKGDTISAAESVKWRARKDGDDYVVTCINSSPIHVSFARLALKQGDKQTEVPGGLASPQSDEEFRFVGAAAAGGGKLTLDLDYITELGAFVPVSVSLSDEG
ncbi:fimbrial biogenesis chaperone [Cupriavidus campinensis]